MNGYLNDGSGERPKLRFYLNTDNLVDLPQHSIWPQLTGGDAMVRLQRDGFHGVQIGGDVRQPISPDPTFPFTGLGRVSTPADADALFAERVDRGDQCLTLHVGWGIEDDDEACRLVEAVLTAAQRHRLPAFIETHRATITQDMWRTVRLTKTFPEIRFNADFSHYYCGQEMVYGDFGAKLDFMQPIFDRVGYIHGRIASPGRMQASITRIDERPAEAVGEADYLADFKRLWTRAMSAFQCHAPAGSVLIFSPELLTPFYYYAGVSPGPTGAPVETGDRYAEALLYLKIADACFRDSGALA